MYNSKDILKNVSTLYAGTHHDAITFQVNGMGTIKKRSMTFLWNDFLNPLSAYPTKWSNTLKQFVGNLLTNCLSVLDHFVGLALKWPTHFSPIFLFYTPLSIQAFVTFSRDKEMEQWAKMGWACNYLQCINACVRLLELISEAYLEPAKCLRWNFFAKIVDDLKPIVFDKLFSP